MPRTTLNLDAAVLRDLKKRQKREGRPLGDIASELLARSLREEVPASEPKPFRWRKHPMNMKINLEDREALWAFLDSEIL